ncbi:MAG TPA: GNAT family N-acetyltransferase [Candidatus Baltobacteraceae bacterium]|nr:GNAT family N-acetyltransferase [Candidatus Baltobacteraceae bacterium]
MERTDVSIRRAGVSDLEALLPLLTAYRVFYKQQPDAPKEREYLDSHLRNDTSVIYLAEIAGMGVVGFTQLFKTFSTVHLADAWILEDLFVAPRYRGAGVAAALLQRAVEHAQETRACGMFLETAKDNATAQRVYERAGWAREARFFKYNAPL